MLGLDLNEKLKLDEQDSITVNSTLTSPKTIIETPTKSYNDSLSENNKNRRDLSTVFNDQEIEFDKSNLTKLDSVKINRNPSSDNELSTKEYFDKEDKNTTPRYNQTLESSLKVCVGDDVYNHKK